jgi:RNA polymerase sigma factor (sigma-70 family)
MRAVGNLDRFVPRGEGAFLAYCLEALRNRLRDEYRRGHSRPGHEALDESAVCQAPSPFDMSVQSATFARYESALHTLTPERQEAIVARFELGYSHAEVAIILGKSGAEAARKFIARAVLELASAMKHDG